MAEIQPNWQQIYQTNKGSAHVWQGNPGLDILKQDYAKRQQEQALNTKDFTAELAKLNYNGARDADMPELHGDYGKILDTFQKYRSSNDPKQQQALNLQMRQMQNQFLYKAQVSKQENDLYHEDAKMAHNPNVDLDDSFFPDMKDRAKVSSFDPKYDDFKNKSYIVPKVDFVKDATEIAKPLTKTTTTSTDRYNKATGSLERVSDTGQEIDHDKFINGWVGSHMNSPNKVKAAIRETGEQDPDKAVLAMGEKMYDVVSGGGKDSQKVSGGGLTMQSRYALQDNAARLKALYPTFAQGQSLTPIYRQKWIKDMLEGAAGSGEALVNKLKADPSYANELGIKVNGDDIRFTIPATKKYNKTTQEFEDVQPSRVVTINKKDPNADVQLNEMVNQLTGEKVDISALRTPGGKKHVLTQGQQNAKTYTIKGKSYKHESVEKAAKASGMSVDEYLKAIGQ